MFNLIIFCAQSSNKDDKAGLEKQALLLAIQNTTLPRLLANDVPAVRIILWDLFHLSNPESKDAMMTVSRHII